MPLDAKNKSSLTAKSVSQAIDAMIYGFSFKNWKVEMGRPNIPHSGPHLQYNLSGIGGLLTFEDIDVIEMPPLGFQPSFEELMPSEKSMFEVFSALAPVIQPPGPDTAVDGGSLLLGGLAITSLVGVGVFYYYNKKEVDQAVGAAAAAVGTAAETVMTGASDAVDAVTEGVEKIVENLPSGFHDVHTAYPDMFPGYPDEPFGTFVRAAYVNEAFIDALGQTPEDFAKMTASIAVSDIKNGVRIDTSITTPKGETYSVRRDMVLVG